MNKSRLLSIALFILVNLITAQVYADCINPAGKEADILYNGDNHTYQFCNGGGWLAFSGGSNCTATGSYSGAAPPAAGYFVMSKTTWTGNLGTGLEGADALCLTDLTTNTGWLGYATANSAGFLVAGRVHAFLCDNTSYGPCNTPMPLTTYYFADANNVAHGGASFTTDSYGLGPNDSATWSGASYFGATYNYWTNMGTQHCSSSSNWGGGPGGGPCQGSAGDCNNWSDGTAGHSSRQGNSNYSDYERYVDGNTYACNVSAHLLCYVDP